MLGMLVGVVEREKGRDMGGVLEVWGGRLGEKEVGG